MNCWDILELEPGSEEKAIKRRYAQFLKRNRPDDDPSAFQRLREAYEQAIEIARWATDEAFDDAQSEIPHANEQPESDKVFLPIAQVWDFAGYSPSVMKKNLTRAESEGSRKAFEQALLGYCLDDFITHRETVDWALRHLHWFEFDQHSELSPDELDNLARCLTQEALEELSTLLAKGEEKVFVERLEQILMQFWLQALDRRAWFQLELMNLLLEQATWSPEFFDRVSQVCNWDGTHLGNEYQWNALVQEVEASICEKRLRGFIAENQPSSPEQYAAWVLLKPMPENDRNKLMARMRTEDWQACAQLSDALQYRHPQLMHRFDEPDLNAWRQRLPTSYGEGWAHIRLALWLLLMLLMWPLIENDDDLMRKLLVSAMSTSIAMFICSLLYKTWVILLIVLDPFDRWLSRWVVPSPIFIHGRGLLLLRHILPAALLCIAVVAAQGGMSMLQTTQGKLSGLLLFLGVSYYLYCAVQGVSLLGLMLGKIRFTSKWLLIAGALLLIGWYMHNHGLKALVSGASKLSGP